MILLLVLLVVGVQAQDVYNSSGKANYHVKKKKGYDPDKLILGGSVIVNVGGGYTNLGISPLVGYRLSKHLSAGVGVGYQYFKYVSATNAANTAQYYTKGNFVYPNVWARYFVYRNIYLSTAYEYDIMSLTEPFDQYNNLKDTHYNLTNSALFVGAGVRQPLGGRVSIYAELVYDVLKGVNSPYSGVMPRIGIATGL